MNTEIFLDYVDMQERWSRTHDGMTLAKGFEETGTGIKYGVWDFFDNESKLLIARVTYVEGNRHGKSLIYLASDEVLFEFEGKINRIWIEERYKNEQLYKRIHYYDDGSYRVEQREKDKFHGMQISYHQNSNIFKTLHKDGQVSVEVLKRSDYRKDHDENDGEANFIFLRDDISFFAESYKFKEY